MEDAPITPQETSPAAPIEREVEQRLAALSQQLLEHLEKTRQAQDARQESIEEKERELARREWAAKARALLRERGLPEALADCLSFSDEAAVQPGIDALEEAFRQAVQAGVEERLTADVPKTGALTPLNQLSDEEYYAAVCRSN